MPNPISNTNSFEAILSNIQNQPSFNYENPASKENYGQILKTVEGMVDSEGISMKTKRKIFHDGMSFMQESERVRKSIPSCIRSIYFAIDSEYSSWYFKFESNEMLYSKQELNQVDEILNFDSVEASNFYQRNILRGNIAEMLVPYVEVKRRGKSELFYRMTSEENQDSTFEWIIKIENSEK